MRTNIDIDDALLKKAMRLTGQTTKKGAVEEALRHLIRLEDQRKALFELRDLGWDGNLEKIEAGWPAEPVK